MGALLAAPDDGSPPLVPASGLVAVWLGRESLIEDCGLLPVWLGIELSDAVEDGVAPLPALRLPLPLLGLEPLGMFASFEGEAICGDGAVSGAGVLLMAGLPAAGSGVCADASAGESRNKAASAMLDRRLFMMALHDGFPHSESPVIIGGECANPMVLS
jgi:hypothetical protein